MAIGNLLGNLGEFALNAIGTATPYGIVYNIIRAAQGKTSTIENALQSAINAGKDVGGIVGGVINPPTTEDTTPITDNKTPTTENTTPITDNKESDLKESPLITESGDLENKQEETIENQESKDFDITKYYEDWQKKIWKREDNIRKETQAREDSAYSRAVADMRKAGINPNLVGINPANSGGGIVTAGNVMGNKTSAQSAEIEKMKSLLNDDLQKYITDANNLVKSGVATEQNLMNLLNNIISVAGKLGGLALLG